jgi:hypothetical protein
MKQSYLDSFLPSDPKQRSIIIQYGTKFGITIALILYFIFILNLIRNDKSSLSNTNMALYLVGIIVPLIIFCYFIFSTIEDKKNLVIVFVMIFIVSIMLLKSVVPSFNRSILTIIDYFIEFIRLPPLSDTTSFLIILSLKILLFCIIIVALSIIYNVFLNETYRQKGILGFIFYFLFLIPCLVNDYVRYLFQEFITTPQVVYVLLVIEIVLILLYIYLPKLLSKIYRPDSNKILLNPTYFYYETIISDIKPFVNHGEVNQLGTKMNNSIDGQLINNRILKSYCISMWMITNQPSIGDKQECMMFRYGDSLNPYVGCPYISCKSNGYWKFVLSNTLRNNRDIENDYNVKRDPEGNVLKTELKVPMQRWNYVVLNYHDSEVDIFINGVLRETLSLGENIPEFQNDMNITIGSDDNLLHGAICNVEVSPSNMNLTQIAQTYNLLKLKNPPVNNLI